MRLALLISIILLNGICSHADELCIRDSTEFSSLKEKIPELFKEMPIVLGTDDEGMFVDIYVVLKIYVQKEAIVLKSESWQGVGYYTDSGEIQKVCFNTKDNTLKIIFNNNKEFKASYSKSEIKVPGATLKRITIEQQRAITNKINLKVKKKAHSEVNQ